MTRQQLIDEAVAHMQKATWPPEKWAYAIKYGYRGKPYRYVITENFKAQQALWQAVHAIDPPPPPNPGPDLSLAQSWVFMAEEPAKCLIYHTYYGIAFTADPAYEKPTASVIAQLRMRGQRVRSWCDCRTTLPFVAKKMAADRGLDGWIGEGESEAAFDIAHESGAEIIIGNLSALRDEQRGVIRRGEVLWINELYLNQDPARAFREDWKGLPVAGRCIASYDASGEASIGRRFPVSEYLSWGKFQAHRDSFYDPGARDEDRRALP